MAERPSLSDRVEKLAAAMDHLSSALLAGARDICALETARKTAEDGYAAQTRNTLAFMREHSDALAEIERLHARLAKIADAPVDPDNAAAMVLKHWAALRDGEA